MKFIIFLIVSLCGIVFTTTSLPKVSILSLGKGIDALDYSINHQAVLFNYSKGELNDEGTAILPNWVVMRKHPQSDYSLYSQVINHWANITDVTKMSLSGHVGFWKIKGTLSANKEWIHQYISSSTYKIARTSAHIKRHTLEFPIEELPIHPSLEKDIRLMAILLEHDTNATRTRANYISNEILRRFGTDIITGIILGAVLLKDDIVDTSKWQSYTEGQLSATASASFGNIFGIKGAYDHTKVNMEKYSNALVETKVHTIGGQSWDDTMVQSKWIDTIDENLAVVDTSGVPIFEVITPERFSDISPGAVQQIRDLIYHNLEKYAKDNTHEGCLDLDSTNFCDKCNVDNGYCEDKRNFTFGGIMQTSNCPQFQVTNEITKTFECPPGFKAYPLLSSPASVDRGYKCERHCYHEWIVIKKCYTSCYYQHPTCNIMPIVCEAPPGHPASEGSYFAGMFTPLTINPYTGLANCPTNYMSLEFAQQDWGKHHITLCYAPFDVHPADEGADYGGMFTCQIGNPLAHNKKICPPGFDRHSLGIINNCEWSFCMGIKDDIGRIKIVPPGYGQPPPPFVDMIPIPDSDKLLVVNMTSDITYKYQLHHFMNHTNPSHDSHHEPSNIGFIVGMSIMACLSACLFANLIIVIAILIKKN